MKDFIKNIWMPLVGSISSLSFKKISDEVIYSPDVIDTAARIAKYAESENKSLLQYFLIGVVGAAGGLVLKITWGCIKRWFPKLKNIDK
jgi:hypothetical protein